MGAKSYPKPLAKRVEFIAVDVVPNTQEHNPSKVTKSVGILFLLAGLIIKAFFSHNLKFWSISESISIILFAIGLSIIFVNLIRKDKNGQMSSVGLRIPNLLKKIIALAICLLIIISLINVGEKLNKGIENYMLSDDTTETTAKITGVSNQSFYVRYRHRQQYFYNLQWNINQETYIQALDLRKFDREWNGMEFVQNNKGEVSRINYRPAIGREIRIRYSNKYPSFF